MANFADIYLMKKSNLIVTSKKMETSIFSGFHWYDILLINSNYDTLIYIPEVNFKPSFNHLNKFKSIELKSPIFHLNTEFKYSSLSDINLDISSLFSFFFSESIFINRVTINNGELLIKIDNEIESYRSLELTAESVSLGNQYNFFIKHLSWLNRYNKKNTIKSKFIELNKDSFFASEFQWEYMNSFLHLDIFSDRDSSVLNIKNFVFNASDVQDFIVSWPLHPDIIMSADIYVNNDSLSIDKIVLNSQNNSLFSCFLSVDNWRGPSNQFANIICDSLNLNPKEWKFIEPYFQSEYDWSSFGQISSNFIAQGNFTDFDINLSLQSSIGDINSSLNFINIDSKNNQEYFGDVILSDFNLGFFLKNEDFKLFAGKFNLNGKGFRSNSFLSDINGAISILEFKDYHFQDIIFNGRFEPNYISVKSEIRDPNLNLNFSSDIDFSNTLANMNLIANISEVNLVKLNIPVRDSVAKLSGVLKMNFEGADWNNFDVTINALNTNLQTLKNDYHFDKIFFNSQIHENFKKLSFVSDFINANIQGIIDMPNLIGSVETYFVPHIPALKPKKSGIQDFNFNINLINSEVLKEFFSSDIDIDDKSFVFGNFNSIDDGFDLSFECPNLRWKEWSWKNVKLNSLITSKNWELDCQGSNFYFKDKLLAENIDYDQVGKFGNFRNTITWHCSDSLNSNGILKANSRVNKNKLAIQFESSDFYFLDTLWSIDNRSTLKLEIDNFQTQIFINSKLQNIEFNYNRDLENYFSSVFFNNLNTINFSPWYSNSTINGQINGFFNLRHQFGKDKLFAEFHTDSIYLNNELFGLLELGITYDELSKKHKLFGDIHNHGDTCMSFEGYFPLYSDSNKIDLDLEVFDFNMTHVNHYLPFLNKIKGKGIGLFHFYGPIRQPKFEGDFIVDDLGLSIPFLNTDFSGLGYSSCHLSSEKIEFNEIDFHAVENEVFHGRGLLDGVINHNFFKDFDLDINLDLDSVLALNTDISSEEVYHGRALASGDVKITGFSGDIQIDVDAIFEKGTNLFVSLDNDEDLEDLTCVYFVEDKGNQKISSDGDVSFEESNSGLSIDMNLELNEETEIHILFDETLGDKLTTRGSGFLNLGINKADKVFMFGDYTLNGGEYLFTLQNFVNKKFEIEKGSKFIWEGEPSKAQMNLKALYKITPNIEPLSPGVSRNSEVQCGILMSGNLLQPSIEFDIKIPNADEEVRRALANQINTDERKTQQFLSLLVLNCFMSSQDMESTDIDYLSSTVSSGAEVLNNQLFNWSSQFSEKFDLGFKYHPNLDNTINNKEFELLLTNMKVNDRITLNGNIGTLAGQNTTKIIGDFKVEYQISRDRKLRMIAFRSLEESPLLDSYENSYTKGLGLFYKDEFKDSRDLWNKFKLIFKQKNRIRQSS